MIEEGDRNYSSLKQIFITWQQAMRQIRKGMNITLKQKENHCFFFLRKYVNSKRMHNRTCLWILNLAKMKIVFKKIFEILLYTLSVSHSNVFSRYASIRELKAIFRKE